MNLKVNVYLIVVDIGTDYSSEWSSAMYAGFSH